MTCTRFTRVASWHRICFTDLGEPPTVVSQGLLATRGMLAVTPSRGASIADFSSPLIVPLRTGYPPPSHPRPSHPGRPCNACVAPLEPQPSPPLRCAIHAPRKPGVSILGHPLAARGEPMACARAGTAALAPRGGHAS